MARAGAQALVLLAAMLLLVSEPAPGAGGSRGSGSGERIAGGGARHGSADAPLGSRDTLTVLFTGETRGNLVPCSCPTHPQGGLARRVRFLQDQASLRARGGTVLRLDAGGFLPEGEVALRNRPGIAERYVRLVLTGLRSAGMQATALDHGEEEVLRRLAPAETAALAEMFLEADPPGRARLLSWSGARIAVLALDESLADSVIRRSALAARAEADYLLILARADAISGGRLARLARADLVILSRGARTEGVLHEGPVPMVGCGSEGHEVGEIRLIRSDPPPPGSPPNATGRLRVISLRFHSMDASLAEDPAIGQSVRALLLTAGSGFDLSLGTRE